jgi:hypothetical protein
MFALRSVDEFIAPRRIVSNAINKIELSYGDIQKIFQADIHTSRVINRTPALSRENAETVVFDFVKPTGAAGRLGGLVSSDYVA